METRTTMYCDDLDVHIRFMDGTSLTLAVKSSRDTIDDITDKIRHATLSRTAHKNIRLIHNGRMLESGRTLEDYAIDYISPVEPDSVSAKTPPRESSHLGFDRLLDSGYNEEEIEEIRRQFHKKHGHESYLYDGESTEQAVALEEQWIEATGEVLPEGMVQGTFTEMLCGFLLGIVFGIFSMMWFRELVFTRRHQIGMVVGFMFNIYGIWMRYH